jgi:hypothetical protein
MQESLNKSIRFSPSEEILDILLELHDSKNNTKKSIEKKKLYS